jgi:hypothetical protein
MAVKRPCASRKLCPRRSVPQSAQLSEHATSPRRPNRDILPCRRHILAKPRANQSNASILCRNPLVRLHGLLNTLTHDDHQLRLNITYNLLTSSADRTEQLLGLPRPSAHRTRCLHSDHLHDVRRAKRATLHSPTDFVLFLEIPNPRFAGNRLLAVHSNLASSCQHS